MRIKKSDFLSSERSEELALQLAGKISLRKISHESVLFRI
jgi:hypothetical protein